MRTFCISSLVAGSLTFSVAFRVSSTSTRVDGSTKPDTPTTWSTATVMARMPSLMITGSPPPAPIAASLDERIGSFSCT